MANISLSKKVKVDINKLNNMGLFDKVVLPRSEDRAFEITKDEYGFKVWVRFYWSREDGTEEFGYLSDMYYKDVIMMLKGGNVGYRIPPLEEFARSNSVWYKILFTKK